VADSSWIETMARSGYAAKGAVHILVGAIAAHAAIGESRAEGSSEALRSLTDQPFGAVLLGLVAAGLAGYVMWRMVEAFWNPEDKGVALRILFIVSGIIYAGLALEAGRLAIGERGGDGGGHWSADLMTESWGVWVVGAAGALIAGYGLIQIYKAFTAQLSREMDLSALSRTARPWTLRSGRFGLAARGVVLGIIGALVITAAMTADAQQASSGLGEALRILEGQAYGPWLLGAVALGLVAHGMFLLVKAAYRRIPAR
jgi:hypothetical protein